MMKSDVEITCGLNNSVVVDGVDLTDSVDFVGFQFEPGNTLPIVTLGIKGEVKLVGEAKVEYLREVPTSTIICEFLESLDVRLMTEVALEGDLSGKYPVSEAYIRYLKERALERD